MALDGALEPHVLDDQVSKPTDSGRKLPELSRLEDRLGHRFRDRSLLETALTHMSADTRRIASYQRLEFLGDRVLGLSVADMLFTTYPQAEEGDMSRRLADLVRKETCAEVATAWDVGPHLRLGEGEIFRARARTRRSWPMPARRSSVRSSSTAAMMPPASWSRPVSASGCSSR